MTAILAWTLAAIGWGCFLVTLRLGKRIDDVSCDCAQCVSNRRWG